VTTRDELGVLTESFNSMTRQLEEAHHVVESNRAATESAKVRLESILANLSAGVLVFDHELGLSISNHGAAAIIGGELEGFFVAFGHEQPIGDRRIVESAGGIDAGCDSEAQCRGVDIARLQAFDTRAIVTQVEAFYAPMIEAYNSDAAKARAA